MRAFFEARIEHLSIHDRVRVDCLGKMPDGSRCNRVSLIAVQGLLKPGWLPIAISNDISAAITAANSVTSI